MNRKRREAHTRRALEAGRRTMMVHYLSAGAALCRFTTAVPADWPLWHSWVRLPERGVGHDADATCPRCREAFDAMNH